MDSVSQSCLNPGPSWQIHIACCGPLPTRTGPPWGRRVGTPVSWVSATEKRTHWVMFPVSQTRVVSPIVTARLLASCAEAPGRWGRVRCAGPGLTRIRPRGPSATQPACPPGRTHGSGVSAQELFPGPPAPGTQHPGARGRQDCFLSCSAKRLAYQPGQGLLAEPPIGSSSRSCAGRALGAGG